MRSSALLAGMIVLAGCVGSPADDAGADVDANTAEGLPRQGTVDLDGTMRFAASVVSPALHVGHGLFEPTIDVSSSGIIYVSAHTIGVGTTGAPAFYSVDDGGSWRQLPFAKGATMPEPSHGSTPPPSDEIFIVAGDDGQAWGVDIVAASYPVNGWCGDGAEHCYHNPNAYDEAQAHDARTKAITGEDTSCSPENLNDRPWAAYANGTLLMVNNPFSGPVQVGVLRVPPPSYVDAWTPIGGPVWNLCAGEGGGSVPGIPALRDEGSFVVPQMQDDELVVVTGDVSNVMDVEQRTVSANTHVPVSAMGARPQATFDDAGNLFVVAMNNTAGEAGVDAGGIRVATSTDDGETFSQRSFRFDRPVSSVFIDGNDEGPGAVINWGLVDEEGGPTDWYLAHLHGTESGTPTIENASLAVEDGPPASRHVQGAAVGPDGRSYMVTSEVAGNDPVQMAQRSGSTPLSVVVQQAGPTLPMT